MAEKRRTRRYALAFWFSTDISSIQWYQPTRSGKVPLFASGNTYYCAVRKGEKPPADDNLTPWVLLGECYGYGIMKADTKG